MAVAHSTTMFDVYDRYVALLTSALSTTSTKWHVSDGEPRVGEYDYVAAVLGATGWEQEPAGIGSGAPSFPLDERYAIESRIFAWDGTIDQARSRAVIKEAYNAILSAVRADPTLGGTPGVIYCHVGVLEYEQGVTNLEGSAAQLDINLNVYARIS